MIETVLDTWRSSRVDEVMAVVHPDDRSMAEACRGCGVEVVSPSLPPPEMKDSVIAAIRQIAARFHPTPADAWLLAPADMPELSTVVINQLIASHEPERPRILVPLFAGRRGHPVLFPWLLSEEVDRLAPNEGINQLLTRHEVREIKMSRLPPPRDFDTPEEFQRLSS